MAFKHSCSTLKVPTRPCTPFRRYDPETQHLNEEELDALIRRTEEELRKVGLSELIGASLYLDRRDGVEDEGDDARDSWPQRTYLLGLLEAFDRHLAVRGDEVRREAINRINEHQHGNLLNDAVILVPVADREEPDVIPLRGMEGVGPLREHLGQVIAFVRSAELRPDSSPGMDL